MPEVVGRADGSLDFDSVIDAIRVAYPGARITVPDYYADRYARGVQVAKDHGLPIPSPPLDCILRVGEERGLQRQIVVPFREGVSLTGRLDRLECWFRTETSATEIPTLAELESLIEILRRAGMKVDVEGFSAEA